MSIRKIKDFTGSEELHRMWEFIIDGKILVLKRYGTFCYWNKLVLEKDSREVYRITQFIRLSRKEKDTGIREEFFYGEFFRRYIGNKSSFVEYLQLAGTKESLPDETELISGGLSKKLARSYGKKLTEILSSR